MMGRLWTFGRTWHTVVVVRVPRAPVVRRLVILVIHTKPGSKGVVEITCKLLLRSVKVKIITSKHM